MAITLIVGKPRTGKGQSAVEMFIRPAWAEGRMVVTNVPLVLEAWRQMDPARIDLLRVYDKDVPTSDGRGLRKWGSVAHDYTDHTDWIQPGTEVTDRVTGKVSGRRCLFVVDEAHLPCPAMKTDPAVSEFFDMHGHYGVDVVLITQYPGKIMKNVREMAAFCWVIKVGSWVRLWHFPLNVFRRGSLYYAALYDGHEQRAKLSSEVRSRNPATFALYRSHEHGGVPLKAPASKPLWRRPRTWIGAAIVGVWLNTCTSFFASDDEAPAAVAEVAAPVVEPVEEATAAPAAAPAPVAPAHPLAGAVVQYGSVITISDPTYGLSPSSTMLLVVNGQRWHSDALQHLGYQLQVVGSGDLLITWPGRDGEGGSVWYLPYRGVVRL